MFNLGAFLSLSRFCNWNRNPRKSENPSHPYSSHLASPTFGMGLGPPLPHHCITLPLCASFLMGCFMTNFKLVPLDTCMCNSVCLCVCMYVCVCVCLKKVEVVCMCVCACVEVMSRLQQRRRGERTRSTHF